MLHEFLILAFALIVLAKASTMTISSAIRLSKLSGISEMTVGFIFIALATSIPETSIAVISSLQGEGAISFGNLVGANITLLTLTFAIMAFYGMKFKMRGTVEIDKAIIITTMVAVFLLLIGQSGFMLGIFFMSLFYLFSSFVYHHGIQADEVKGIKTVETVKSILMVILSGLIIVVSAHVVVSSAVSISADLGLAETIIGATLVALGTTLPEISVNIAAIKRKKYSLAIGDSIGSIVTNMTLILGIASVISPIAITQQAAVLLGSLIFVNMIFIFISYRPQFGFKEGSMLLIIYLTYLMVTISV